jgi:hypothetical protein
MPAFAGMSGEARAVQRLSCRRRPVFLASSSLCQVADI